MTKNNVARSCPRFRAFLMFIIVICSVGMIVLFVNWVIDQINLSTNGEPDFNTLTQSEMKDGLFVTGTIDNTVGPYAEDYTVKNSRRTSAFPGNYYYLVPIYANEGATIECFVSYKAGFLGDSQRIENIIGKMYGETGRKPLILEHGRMIGLDSEQKSILKNWVSSNDFYENGSFVDYCVEHNLMGTTDKDVILSKILTYSIEKTNSAGINLADVGYIAVPIGVCAIILLIIHRYDKTKIKKKPQVNEFEALKNYDVN